MKNISICLILSTVSVGLLFQSCQEPYEPDDVSNSDDVLVVQAQITDQPGPYVVSLSWANGLNQVVPRVVSNAQVSISDNGGKKETLHEDVPGHYKTAVGGIQGVVGRTYRLQIKLSDGRQYISTGETMLEPLLPDSIYAEKGTKDYIEKDVDGEFMITTTPGLYIYADVHQNITTQSYFKFDNAMIWQSVYQLGPNGPSPITVYHRVPKYLDGLPNIKAAVLSNNAEVIKKTPIAFLPYIRDPFEGNDSVGPYTNMGWIVSTKLSKISQSSYNYYTAISKQLNAEATIFDPIPTQVPGNIRCVSDSNLVAIGLFEVFTSTRKNRYFYWAPSDKKIISADVLNPGPFTEETSIRFPFDYWIDYYDINH